MSEFTPTTEEVRAKHAWLADVKHPSFRKAAEFDRWLQAHDREVAARTLEAAAKAADEDADWEWLEGASFWLTERAAALPSGTEGSTDV